MFDRMGAREVVAIEGNARAYLKCLVSKEVLGMSNVRFEYGDFMEFLRGNAARFDVANASGVLYHQRNPAELIALLARTAKAVIIWTHYYSGSAIRGNPRLRRKFAAVDDLEHAGFRYRAHRHDYGSDLKAPTFFGGNAAYSHWMTRDDLTRCLRHFGFADIQLSFESVDHPHGPCINLTAFRA